MAKRLRKENTKVTEASKNWVVRRYRLDELAEHSRSMSVFLKLFPSQRYVRDASGADSALGVIVSAEDTEKAEANRGNPAACAMALAVGRQAGVVGAVINRSISIVAHSDGTAIRYKTPNRTYSALYAFDMGGVFEPGVYVLGPMSGAYSLAEAERRRAISAAALIRRPIKRRAKKSVRRRVTIVRTSKLRQWGAAHLPAFINPEDAHVAVK